MVTTWAHAALKGMVDNEWSPSDYVRLRMNGHHLIMNGHLRLYKVPMRMRDHERSPSGHSRLLKVPVRGHEGFASLMMKDHERLLVTCDESS